MNPLTPSSGSDDGVAASPWPRDPICVERWPECESGAYDPRCCRFPKSCSCTVFPDNLDVATTVAALYVEKDGAYFGLPGVDPWDEERDARLYAGPWPVVAHPPCARWSLMGMCRGYRDGKDDGCFEAALHAVRTYGGVLEHPAHSLAWERFDLPRPGAVGWASKMFDSGWSCQLDQRWYGHPTNKPTWLYCVGCELPTHTYWGRAPRGDRTVRSALSIPGGDRSYRRAGAPVEFRDFLLGIARSTRIEVVA